MKREEKIEGGKMGSMYVMEDRAITGDISFVAAELVEKVLDSCLDMMSSMLDFSLFP